MSKAVSKNVKPKPKGRRINLRALVALVALIAVAVPGFVVVKMVRDQSGAKNVLAEGKAQLAKGNPSLALNYLTRYLELVPDDLDAMDLKSKILFDTAHDQIQVMEALRIHGQLIARKPDDPRWDQARRRMIRLNLKAQRWRSALEIARRWKSGDRWKVSDAEAHRLYARASAAVGVSEKSDKEIEDARKEYEAAEKIEPGDVTSAEELAGIYRQNLEKPEKALEVLNQVVLNTGRDPKKESQAYLARARHFLATHQTSKASDDVDAAVNDDPSGVMPRVMAAEIALDANRPDEARIHLSKVDPAERKDLRNDLLIRTLEGRIDLAESSTEEAILTWRTGLLEVGGNDVDLTWRLANILLETGRVSDAEPLMNQYRRLVGGDEPDYPYLYLGALAMLKSNRPAEAAAQLEKIRYKAPKLLEPMVLNALGQSYEATRNTPKAVEAYRQASESLPRWSFPRKALARLQAVTRPEDAQATLQNGLALTPENAELLTARAEYLYTEQMKKPAGQRSLAEVEALLDRAGKSDPRSAGVALFRAQVYADAGRPEDALERLKAATGLTPRTPALWLALANLLTGLNRPGEAQDVLDQATRAAGPQAIFYITRAHVLITQGHLSDARKVLVEGLDRVPKEQKSQLWKSVGDFYQGQKDYDSAAEAFRRWAELQPENPEPRLSLFGVAMLKRDEAAVAAVNEATVAAANEAAVDAAIEDVKRVSGERSYFWRVAKVENLLHERKGKSETKPTPKALDEAAALIKEIQANDPQLALGYLLEARLCERREQVDEAIVGFRKALDRGAGTVALTPLVALLAREKRDDEIQKLRKAYPGLATGIEQWATAQAIQSGDKERAERLARKVVEGDPQGLSTRQWEIDVFRALDKPKDAETAARKWVGEKPNDLTPRLMLMMLQLKAGDKAGAADTVEQIRQNVKSARPELLLAQCYQAVGNIPAASENMREAVQRHPEDFAVLSGAATFYEQTGRRTDAEDALRLILRNDKANVWAKRKLALSLCAHAADRKAWDEALSLVGPEARRNDVPDDLIIRAAVYAQGPEPSHLRKAVEILEAMVSEMPNRVDLQEQLARMLVSSGDPAGARVHAARAAEGDQAKPDTILFYAGVLLGLKDVPAAEEQLARLTRTDADGLPVVELKTRIMAARGQGSEGAKLLEDAYNNWVSTPEGVAVAEKMVQVLLSLKQPEAAERVARRAAEVAPPGRCLLATVLANAGKFDAAAAELDRVSKGGEPGLAATSALTLAAQPAADPRWAERAERFRVASEKSGGEKPTFRSLEHLALLRHVQQNYKAEVETYRKMLELKPANLLFLNNMAWTLSEELNEPGEGLKVINQVIEKVGNQPNVLDTRGMIYTRLGRYQDAVNDFEVAGRELHDPSVDYHLARAYVKMGNPDQARKYRERALKAGLNRERLQHSERADWDAVMTSP